MKEEIPNIKSNGFRIFAKSVYVPEMSDLKTSTYFFAYIIRIHNECEFSATLMRRYWEITNGYGDTQIVEGEGVIGQQPQILPLKSHVYSSYCPLMTPFGFMKGNYEMQDENGGIFKIKVPSIQLITPGTIN